MGGTGSPSSDERTLDSGSGIFGEAKQGLEAAWHSDEGFVLYTKMPGAVSKPNAGRQIKVIVGYECRSLNPIRFYSFSLLEQTFAASTAKSRGWGHELKDFFSGEAEEGRCLRSKVVIKNIIKEFRFPWGTII